MKKSVSNILTKSFLDLLKESNTEKAEQLINKLGISQYELTATEGRVSESAHFRFISEIMKCDEIISETRKASFSQTNIIDASYKIFPDLIGFALNQDSIEDAIAAYVEHRFIIGDCDAVTLTNTNEKLKLTYINEGPTVVGDFSAIGNFMMLYQLARRYAPINNIEIGFTGSHSDDRHLLNECFETKCAFNTNENFIIFNKSASKNNNIVHNPVLGELQRKRLLEMKNVIYKKCAFTAIISDLIEKCMTRIGMISSDSSIMDDVCSIMKISRWTLNDRLKLENTSFSELLKSQKLKISCHLLNTTNKSIQEISELVCFSSISSFSRFFNANLNMSPLSYRKRIRVE